MMKRQGLVIIAGGLPGDRELTFCSDGLLLVGVFFSLVPPLWELCCSLATSDDGTVLGTYLEGAVYSKKLSVPLSPFFPLFLLFFFFLVRTLSSSLSLSLSHS